MVWVGLCRVVLVLIIAGFVILGGKSLGQGLTSRPRETSSVSFLNELLVLFGYPPRSGAALLGGHLLLRYCVTQVCRVPTWKLPVGGRVAGLLAACRSGGHAACVLMVLLVLLVL